MAAGDSTGLVNAFKDGIILKSALFKNRNKAENTDELVLVQNPKKFSDQLSKKMLSIWDVNEDVAKITTTTQDLQSSEVGQSNQQKESLTNSSITIHNNTVASPAATSSATNLSTSIVSRCLELITFRQICLY